MLNKTVYTFAVGSLLLLPISGSTAAAGAKPSASAAGLRATFQFLYGRLDIALAHKDVEGVLALYADDVVAYGKNGKITLKGKPQVRRAFNAMMAHVTTLKENDVIQNLTVVGKTVIVTKKSEMTINGKSDGESSVDRETWVRVGDRWQIKQHRQLQ